MTEQRKQKQRLGLLGHPPHLNINPQQPAWFPWRGVHLSPVPQHSLSGQCVQLFQVDIWLYGSPGPHKILLFSRPVCIYVRWKLLPSAASACLCGLSLHKAPGDLQSQTSKSRKWTCWLELEDPECFVPFIPPENQSSVTLWLKEIFSSSVLFSRIKSLVLHQQTQAIRWFEDLLLHVI